MGSNFIFKVLVGALIVLAVVRPAGAQELEPRIYSNTPVEVNFLAVGYGYSAGNLFLDPALPIEDLDARLHVLFLRYTRTFSLAGVGAKFRVFLPVASGSWSGRIGDGPDETRDAAGLGDAIVSLGFNFLGAPALSRSEFADFKPQTIVGANFHLSVPVSQYDAERLINVSSNRWVLRSELGVSHTIGRWSFEAAGAVLLFYV